MNQYSNNIENKNVALKIPDNKLQCVFWDFDKTILSIHTGGQITYKTPEEKIAKLQDLAKYVSPAFIKQFSLFFLHGKKQAVVTFSDSSNNGKRTRDNEIILSGTELVRGVLKQYCELNSTKVYAIVSFQLLKIEVFGFYPAIQKNLETNSEEQRRIWSENNNKNIHLKMACDLFGVQDKSLVLLIDDDLKNILYAKEAGYQTYHVSENNGYQTEIQIIDYPIPKSFSL